MTEQPQSGYWLDRAVAEITKQHPKGEIIVSSGASPSGSYHVGHLREILTADALAWALRQTGRQARHIHFVDDFDVFRKVPAGAGEEFAEQMGKPLYLVSDPSGDCHPNYAEHFLAELLDIFDALGMEKNIQKASINYPAGKYTESITATLTHLAKVKKIITEVSGRQLPDGWAPVQILSNANRLDEWKYTGWDAKTHTINYVDTHGKHGHINYDTGRVKLDWRLDWPARWSIWGVQVEPFGRDHASKGGSYDTGSELVQEIFGSPAPYPVPYEFINRLGETKKMSASAGTGITPHEALAIMPPEILRYFVLRSKPDRLLYFDSGLGLYNLIEEYSKVETAVLAGQSHEFSEAYKIASGGTDLQTISSVPFSHMVSVYQAALGEFDQILEILERTGYEAAVKEQKEVLKREVEYVKNWLAKYAPDEVKFEVQKDLPKVDLSNEQLKFLNALADAIENAQDLTGQSLHDLIYDHVEIAGKPSDAFRAIYRVILNKDSGPKAGWFLASLDRNWLVKRLLFKA